MSGRRNQNIGKHGEALAANTLRVMGIEMVEKIGTPVKTFPSRYPGLYRVVYGEKVSGDYRGILPGGRSVLVETKTILDRNLRYSDLREHQPGRLTQHCVFGGLSLLVWVHGSGVYVLEWPIVGFGPGKSLTVEQAEQNAVTQSVLAAWIEPIEDSKEKV